MKASLVAITPEAELHTVRIARVSSNREDKDAEPEKLINYLIKNKHWSPFEHSYMTVEIVTTKAISIQLLRHRSFTFQEFSQRYAEVIDLEDFKLRKQSEKNRQSSTEEFYPTLNSPFYYDEYTEGEDYRAYNVINDLNQAIRRIYTDLLRAGVAKECARMILPMCSQTTLYMTGNLRSWIHFIELRTDAHAQKECQDVANEIKSIFIQECPAISKALNWPIPSQTL